MRAWLVRGWCLALVALGCGCSGEIGDTAGGDGGVAQTQSSTDERSRARGTEYSPYFYVWAWDSSFYSVGSLVEMHARTGTRGATLAFVVAQDGACAASRDIQANAWDVGAFVAAGGHVKASFGGFADTYLENVCPDAASLADAVVRFVDETGITDLDFDVEQPVAMTAEINALRGEALRRVQQARGVKVSFSLPSSPRSATGAAGGIRPDSLRVLTSAVAAGVQVEHVNLMTMDFGPAFSSSGASMGELAVSALEDCVPQLAEIFPGKSKAQLFAMLGATPMIGQNDHSTEVFGLDDAATLARFVKANGVGLLSFWALQRDQPCSSALVACSQAQEQPFEFSAVLMTAL